MKSELLHQSPITPLPQNATVSQVQTRGRRKRGWFSRGRWRQALRENSAFLLMAAPGVLVLLVFSYLPMIGLVLAFKDYLGYQGVFGSAWVGLQNFQFLFGTPDALQSMANTLILNAIFIVTTQVAALAIALLLNEIRDRSKWLTNFYQSTLFFPFFMSWVIVAYFVFALLSDDTGLVNQFLASAQR